MLVDTVNRTIELILAGAVTTTELDWVVSYIDGEVTNFFPNVQTGASNGTTAVVILSVPEERAKRLIKTMSVRNRDTATATVTIRLDDNGTRREIYRVALLVNETLIYTDSTGWKVIDTTGAIKTGGVSFGTPTGNIDIGDSASEGTNAGATRADHQHAFTAPSAAYPVDTDAAAEADGVATTPARSDHRHHATVGVAPANVNVGAAAEGAGDALARATHEHDIDTAAPGTTGVATASGVGSAATLARSDHTHQSNTAPADTTKAAAAIGTSGEPARADHKHDISTAAPAATGVATASAEGAATSLARSDHAHQSNTAPVDTTKATAVIGTSGEPARADHKHDITTAAAVAVGTSNAEGSATTLARSDHVHDMADIGVKVTDASLQSIPNATVTAINFDTERYDTDTMHDNVTNNTRLTATTAGKYLIIGQAAFDTDVNGRRSINIRLNGSTFIAVVEHDTNQNAASVPLVAVIFDLSAADYVELLLFQSSGGAINSVKNAEYTPEFQMHKIG